MPDALLRALIAGREVGKNGVRAIGEDYRELEARQVVKVTPRGNERYTMKLLKRDVGELALTIVRGGRRRKRPFCLTVRLQLRSKDRTLFGKRCGPKTV